MILVNESQEVSSHNETYILLRELSAKEVTCEVYYLGSVGQAWHAAITIKVCAKSYMFDAHDLGRMAEMFYCVDDGGLAVFAEEPIVDRRLCYAAGLGKGTHLVVSKVAWVVAKGTGRAVAAYNGNLA